MDIRGKAFVLINIVPNDLYLIMDYGPKRIICLTEETTETLYLLGESARIVGISKYTVRPHRAPSEKPKVSAFLDANIEDILALQPDLVIGFSDIQAGIAKQLIEKGITVWINNHRSVQGILDMIVQLGGLVGKRDRALELVHGIKTNMDGIQQEAHEWNSKPKVYFEEWFDPIIFGIQWVSELIEIAGGIDIFKDRTSSLAKGRIIEDHQEIVRRDPDIILASWCGKRFKKKHMLQRKNWNQIRAVKTDFIQEIPSEIILQPGPAALTEGLPLLHQIIKDWKDSRG